MSQQEYLAAMRRAVALAGAEPWRAQPRPTVGAVVLDRAGELLAEAVTDPDGPHAEAVALGAAGARARGGSLVVTLEPCAAAGRSGACTDAVLAAGVRRVRYAVADPLAPFAGGAALLAAAGCDVDGGLLAEEAAATLAGWLPAARAGRPVLTWKFAATLDGRSAAADGTSRWISGAASRAQVHQLRSRHDAVLVGVATVIADDPELTVREAAGPDPIRVIADPAGRVPRGARALGPNTIVAIAGDARPAGPIDAQLLPVRRGAHGLDPAALLASLGGRGIRSVLLEGGARLAASFAAAGLVDRMFGYFGPRLLGAGHPVLAEIGVSTIGDAPAWVLEDARLIGGDARLIARPLRGC